MKQHVEISIVVCAIIPLLGGGGCSTKSPNHCESNDLCVPEASCRADTGQCAFWENPLTASRNGEWKDATIGNSYEVEYVASGGFPPYTWELNDGDTVPHLEWLTLVPEGDNNEKAKLQNKAGQLPLLGDINSSGIPIKITVLDYTKRGSADRLDNKGASINETLKINGCADNNCAVCSSKQPQFCDVADFGSANCNLVTKKIKKCWPDSDGCLVWQDQNRDCTGNETCTVTQGDGSVACTCIWGFIGTDCHSPTAGDFQDTQVAGVHFNMRYVPGGTFPTGTADDGTATVGTGFWIGETEVTYELWSGVYSWATKNGYTFANQGRQGGDFNTGPVGNIFNPVTTINWRDAMIWCNAASEAAGLKAVYYIDDKYNIPIRSVDDNETITTDLGTEDNPYVKDDSNGFRLPGTWEWECAARYKDGASWTQGSYASGATADYTNKSANDEVSVYFWYLNGSSWYPTGVAATAEVKTKQSNKLGIYDMSGNVWEWCFDWFVNGSTRVLRGGSWAYKASDLQVGGVYFGYNPLSSPFLESVDLGFRLARTK